MNETAKHISWNQVSNEQLNPLLERRFLNTQNLTLARVSLRKGCVVPRHSHIHEQITYVTEGALRVVFPDKEVLVRAGEVVCIPSNLPHEAMALENTQVIDIFTPAREDWANRDDDYLRTPNTM